MTNQLTQQQWAEQGYDVSVNAGLQGLIDQFHTYAADNKLDLADAGNVQKVIDAVEAQRLAGFAAAAAQTQVKRTAPEHEYKIKRVAKGERIKEASATGKHFSFGPVWVEAVKKAAGIAVNEKNREKLNMHGVHVGVQSPETLDAKALCAAIAEKLAAQPAETTEAVAATE